MTVTKAAKLKNTYSQSTHIFDDIRDILIAHNAREVNFVVDKNKQISAITFAILIDEQLLHFRLPAKVANVEKIFLKQKRETSSRWIPELSENDKKQAYRTCWANIRDWIAIQMAMVETEQAEITEIFLPYLLTEDRTTTYYQALREQHFLLPAPKARDVTITEIEE